MKDSTCRRLQYNQAAYDHVEKHYGHSKVVTVRDPQFLLKPKKKFLVPKEKKKIPNRIEEGGKTYYSTKWVRERLGFAEVTMRMYTYWKVIPPAIYKFGQTNYYSRRQYLLLKKSFEKMWYGNWNWRKISKHLHRWWYAEIES